VLEIAIEQNFVTLAFPSISTGVYGFPVELAAPIAVRTVRDRTRDTDCIETVTFCCFSAADLREYQRALGS
jgi:O-acetyl-ADP-ribose deacetylase